MFLCKMHSSEHHILPNMMWLKDDIRWWYCPISKWPPSTFSSFLAYFHLSWLMSKPQPSPSSWVTQHHRPPALSSGLSLGATATVISRLIKPGLKRASTALSSPMVSNQPSSPPSTGKTHRTHFKKCTPGFQWCVYRNSCAHSEKYALARHTLNWAYCRLTFWAYIY